MKVLYVVKNMRLSNGVASYAMNYYRKLKNHIDQFDFLIISDVGSPYYDEILSNGNHVFFLPSYKKELHKIRPFLSKLFDENKYDILHCHVVNSGSLILMEAQEHRIPVRILHSHATKTGDKKRKEIRNILFSKLSQKYANQYFSCSRLAGDYLFGNKPYTVINNAVDIEKYGFKEETRTKIRTTMKCKNKIIVGTVGRMTIQKNPYFIINIIKALQNKISNFEFWWFGDGGLEEKIKLYAAQLGVLEKIVFFGACKNVHEFYSAMDVFILPSKYEGLPLVGIEAQVSGLQSIFSDKITTEVVIGEGAVFLPIEKSDKWAQDIIKYSTFDRVRNINSLKIESYQIEKQSQVLLEKYQAILKSYKSDK